MGNLDNASKRQITALVLSGGRGRRMGEQDKGLLPLKGKPLVSHVIDRLAPQVGDILISANRHLDSYRKLGFPVLADTMEGFQGPLAGILSGLQRCTTPYLLLAPCDTPFLPSDLVLRLLGAMKSAPGTEIAVAEAAGKQHYLCALLSVQTRFSLEQFLDSGQRRVGDWYRQRHFLSVDFDDQAGAFANLNTPADFAMAEKVQDSTCP